MLYLAHHLVHHFAQTLACEQKWSWLKSFQSLKSFKNFGTVVKPSAKCERVRAPVARQAGPCANLDAVAAERLHDAKAGLVGSVVARKQGSVR